MTTGRGLAALGPAALAVATAAALLLDSGPAHRGADGPLAVAAVLVSLAVGLPHGAADAAGPALWVARPVARLGRFTGYLAAAGATYLLWRLAPLPTLLALLALAVAHFGAADAGPCDAPAAVPGRRAGARHAARVVAWGGLPVLGPIAVHAGAVQPLLGTLSGGHAGVVIAGCRVGLVPVWLATAAVVTDALRRGDRRAAAEPLVLAVSSAVLPPLIGFALYYGLWHSARQLHGTVVEVRHDTTPVRGFVARIATATAATAVGLALLVTVGHGSALPTALVVVLCLTVPHSLCAAAAHRSDADTRPGRRGMGRR